MTSLLNLLLASFLALSPPPSPAAPAATASPAPASKTTEAASRAVYKEMLDETRKINETCVRDHFGKACIAAQEQFQRKFLGKVPTYDGAALGIVTVAPPKK
jgi:hypothetical protein